MLNKAVTSKIISILLGLAIIMLIVRPKLFLPILLIAFVIYSFNKLSLLSIKRQKENKMAEETYSTVTPKKMKKIIFIAVIAVIVIIVLFKSIIQVDAGETGVYHLFGRVSDHERRSGLHLIIPLAKVTRMSIRTEEYTMSIIRGEGKKIGADAITALTKEGLSVDLDITVLYHLMEESASDVYRDVGLSYEEKIIRPSIRSGIREVVARYEAKDIYSEKRQEAAANILAYLQENIGPRGIEIESVLLRNVVLPDKLAGSIQEKLQAEQDAQRMEFVLQKEEKEAERKRVEAAGQRDAQKIINESLTDRYLEYLYISSLKDRQGTIYVPVSPSSGMPMFKNIP